MKAIYQVNIEQDFDWKDVESRIAGEKFIKTTKLFGVPISSTESIVSHSGEDIFKNNTTKPVGFGDN